jgi:hypothetical protein
MQHVSEILKEGNIVLTGADALTAGGYTQVPNAILEAPLSTGAKLVYAMLLKYAWSNDFCFPGQVRLAEDLRVTDRSIRNYLTELRDDGYIHVTQQGLTKPNLYRLDLTVFRGRVSKTARSVDNVAGSTGDRKKTVGPDRKKTMVLERKYLPTNKTQ